MTDQAKILEQITIERKAQDHQWGVQSHPDVKPHYRPVQAAQYYGIPSANMARTMCQWSATHNHVTWADIAIEELCEAVEAFANGDTAEGRAELVQLAAVIVAQIEDIDRRGDAIIPALVSEEPF